MMLQIAIVKLRFAFRAFESTVCATFGNADPDALGATLVANGGRREKARCYFSTTYAIILHNVYYQTCVMDTRK